MRVPCSAAALAASITTANTIPAVLRLRANCTYSITTPTTAATGLPAITGDVTLTGGPGTTIRRDPAAPTIFRILDVAAGGTLRVTRITIANGVTAGLGGGIQNAGTLVLRQTTLTGNRAGNGGAVANNAAATATISRTLLTANTTTGVGGGGLINSSTLTVIDSIISANVAPINGGGVNTQSAGTTRLIQTTLDHNTSGGLGGGLSNLGTTSLDRTLVSANRGSSGGGIASGNTNVTLVRSIVRNNIPDNCNPLNTIPGCVG
ncbi:hypothetical protein [Actinoallomurus bryophytorum]|uniref:hypothetical protein n=1 Tax=Actinoallomurus bryophytorum TaxID=1490222 RepID=UPI00114E26D5|nr:hypothetical protein [Actinoallomurus bryophytorum]